ncbi:ERV/ALR sulfhydryl oxidase domain-containing protein, partial [Phakopsora pachyrhizi]
RTDFPGNSEELGDHTWTFLHSTAAYYPKKPTEQQKSSILDLIGSLPALHPCKICANDVEDQIKESPPRVQSREHLEQWFCEIHNHINRKLGKEEEFDCKFVSKCWRDGWDDVSCDWEDFSLLRFLPSYFI